MLEALLYFIVAFLVTSGLIPLLFDVWKEDSSAKQATSSSTKPNTGAKTTNKPQLDSEDDYQYTFRGQGVAITGCNQPDCTEAKMPAMIRYMPVFSIDSGAFKNCKNLKKVLLPEHIMHIASDAFASTETLTLYGRYDTYAHKYAQEHHIRFRSADSFDTDEQKTYEQSSQAKKTEKSAKTDLPETLRFDYYDVVKENGGLTIKKFVGVDKSVLTVPGELGGMPVLEIDTGAFSDCRYIEKVIIGEGILAIRNGAFNNCPNLREVVLPSTLKSIGDDSAMKTTGIVWPVFHKCALANIHIPPSVINIGNRAFYDCNKLKNIILPEGLEVIGEEAFRGCTGLKEMIIPKSVQHIGKKAFGDLRITLYCYGGSAGLMYARENNFAYKDADELKKQEAVQSEPPKSEAKPKPVEKPKNEILAKQNSKSKSITEVKLEAEKRRKALEAQEAEKKREEEKLLEAKRMESLTDVHNCVQQVMAIQASYSIEQDIANTQYGRVVRHNKYTVIFQAEYEDKGKAEMDGTVIVWEGDHRRTWSFDQISGCECYRDGRLNAFYGVRSGVKDGTGNLAGGRKTPNNGVVIYTKEYKMYILDYPRNNEDLKKVYDTMKYIVGDRSGRCPFRRMSEK